MSQLLFLGEGKYLTIDQSFADSGKPVRYGLVGGQMVQLTDGIKPKPDILRIGKEYFYKNGAPVTKEADVENLPEPHKTQALAFINKGVTKSAPVVSTKEEAVVVKKGRGRPKKVVAAPAGPRRIEIKDEASLLEAAGGVLDTDN